jgi:hypothetical protein
MIQALSERSDINWQQRAEWGLQNAENSFFVTLTGVTAGFIDTF